MKPIEETWTVKWDSHGGYDTLHSAHLLSVENPSDDDWLLPFAQLDSDDGDDDRKECPVQGARARLAAQAPAMARLLLELQWSGRRASAPGEVDPACPLCRRYEDDGRRHEPECELAVILRAAGALP